MKKNEQDPTGPAAALKIVYDTLTKTLKYTHKRLREETGLSFLALQNIRDNKLRKRSPVRNYYLPILIKLLVNEYRYRIKHGGNGAVDILRIMAQILCHENYLGTLLPKEEEAY